MGADDPERLLQQLIAEMTDDLVEAKNHLAECKREERRLAQQVELVEVAAAQWEQRAMSAMRAGDDVVAKDALVRKGQQEDQAEEVRAVHRRQCQDVENLKNALVAQNLRIETAKHKRNEILLRAKRAHVENTISEVILETPRAEPSVVLDRLDERISFLEGEAGLLPELSDEAIASGASAAENAARAETDLLRLKRAMTEPERKPKKPLAKTQAGEATRGRASPRGRAKVAGQKRTKR
jgi:phage shock protein A